MRRRDRAWALAHLHTFTAAIPPRPRRSRATTLHFPLAEGGVLVAQGDLQPRSAPAVIFVHGAGGSSESAYVRRAARAAYEAGFHAIRLNCRGGGLGRGLANRHYHAGLSADLELVALELLKRPLIEDVSLMGFSLGGHMVLRLAGLWAEGVPDGIRALATISAPIDLVHAAEIVWNGPADVYERSIVGAMRANAVAIKRRAPHALLASEERLRTMNRIWEMDALVLAPLWGFRNKEEYYRKASASTHLHNIRVPTLIVHAEDDPVVPFASVEPSLPFAGPGALVRVHPTGGHVGFAGGTAMRNQAVVEALEFFLAQG